jgi:hypothetical protein
MTIPYQCQVFRAISLNLPQIAHVENNEFRNQRRQDAARPPELGLTPTLLPICWARPLLHRDRGRGRLEPKNFA